MKVSLQKGNKKLIVVITLTISTATNSSFIISYAQGTVLSISYEINPQMTLYERMKGTILLFPFYRWKSPGVDRVTTSEWWLYNTNDC